ncbi:Sapep family Mn(2+)-dependent dipeptidase [Neobacillus niacini]|uniref:Sapep family Mn(2+)-dependent dipeptidase n=1 Tax=Neobacillus niacini TaxID=86668 RepID=UPI002FFDABEC
MNSLNKFYYEKLQYYEEELMMDLANLIRIRSVRSDETSSPHAPFGNGIRQSFNELLNIAERDSFQFSDFDGYALHIDYGSGDEIVGILAHLDIVSEGNKDDWTFDPYTLTELNGFLYGRGINDDKAPLLAAYYAMKILRDLNIPLKRKVRLIVGGAEETTWECMEHYFTFNPQPEFAFTPDGDFPIVHCEKGVIQGTFTFEPERVLNKEPPHKLIEIQSERQRGFICETCKVILESQYPEAMKSALSDADEIIISNQTITAIYKGDKALSRNPHKGKNAFFLFAKNMIHLKNELANGEKFFSLLESYLLEDIYGKKIGLFHQDSETGSTTMAIPYVTFDGQTFEIAFDYRFPKGQTLETATSALQRFCTEQRLSASIYKSLDLHYLQQDSRLICQLKQAYKSVTGNEAEGITKGGISYARVLKNGVCFGPTFPGDEPNTHMPNERIRIETLFKSIIIYCETIRLLAS